MDRYKLTISYDGSRYDGWQKQGNTGATIQGKLEDVLSRMAGEPVEVQGAGRTDAGVHARAQVVSFSFPVHMEPSALRDELNRYLPDDIAVTGCAFAPPRFHARLSVRGKRYVYRLWVGRVPNVFERKYLTPWAEPLDVGQMKRGAAVFLGKHDFRAFCANKRYKKSTVRTITALTVEQIGNEVRITFEGDGFLYNMVRILAGTLVEVGMGKRAPEDLPGVLESLDRANAGPTLPARGLILDEVFY